ncbi:hypothetical protein F8O01_15355 [Pseudoclavibacter chungangensis]|uniref:Transposase n=1 Tax=Pseudoclavibacter chungangensis TaxID=587635 RepID=A0A7J5BNH2_9MICO|nr:hypothetical protein [Pseudoclavibacter chungangensis]KAB1653444.1 hypothetical protein F8O01_15355 [Pseudoclavibacter chungangensis]NYJ66380.1 IS30 family transposase [Pseudoclavibacter chungangensis]
MRFTLEPGTKEFFVAPLPWRRPTSENAHGLLRRCFPGSAHVSGWCAEDLEADALAIDDRPHVSLARHALTDVYEEHLRSLRQTGVATTG